MPSHESSVPPGAPASAAEASGPPEFDELPEWFQRRFEEDQARKTRVVVAARGRAQRAYRRITVAGAFTALFGFVVFAGVHGVLLGIIMTGLGALGGALVVRRDATRLGAIIVYALPLVVASLALALSGRIRLNGLSAVGFFGCWLFWISAASLLAILNDRERTEVLPF